MALLKLQDILSPYSLYVAVPALYIYGNTDRVISSANIEYVKANIGSSAKLEIVDNGGHFYTKKGITEVNELIAGFCS